MVEGKDAANDVDLLPKTLERQYTGADLPAAAGPPPPPPPHVWRYTSEKIEAVISQLPPWQEQLSMRSFVLGTFLGLVFAIISLKLSLGSAGIVPSLNIPAGLLSFALLKAFTGLGGITACGRRGGKEEAGGKEAAGGGAPPPGGCGRVKGGGGVGAALHHALFRSFGVQENAVLQTYILSVSGVAFTGGFGFYMTAMAYQAYLNLGGAPKGTPGFREDEIIEPVLRNTVPYLLMTAVLGVFMLTQMRKLMICDWRLPFPSGTASGIMLTSFHTAAGEASALRKVRVLLSTGAGSFGFSLVKWVVSGADYGCGFDVWPSFGFKALKYTWNIDWQLNYIGSGMICPHIVNWSMLFGAVLSWGFMWPLLETKAGDWYPAGLKSRDFKGLFAYKVFLVIALMMGEGLYMVGRVVLSSGRDTVRRVRAARRSRALKRAALAETSTAQGSIVFDMAQDEPEAMTSERVEGHPHLKPLPPPPGAAAAAPEPPTQQQRGGAVRRAVAAAKGGEGGGAAAASNGRGPAPPAPTAPTLTSTLSGKALVADGDDDDDDATRHLLQFKETADERRLRTEVFLREAIPWWLAPAGYGGLAVLSTICIPLIMPAVKWYYVLTAYIVTPLFAVPNAYGNGLTDWDNCSMYGKLVLFIFAAWAGAAGNGVIVGLGICGVVFGATSSAATLLQDFRTGYICLAAPRAMFVAQLVGQLVGAMLVPVCFMLFYATGQVNVPHGPYPAPFSDIYRGMAVIGTLGFSALPKYCAVLMLAFFLGAIAICIVRDLLPPRYARFVPSPMAMALPFYIGANTAINFWMGSLIMHAWEFLSPSSADELGPTVGAGLLVGDGLWSIPQAILAIAGVNPPVCLGFYGPDAGCKAPYCAGFWLGGSERVPHAA